MWFTSTKSATVQSSALQISLPMSRAAKYALRSSSVMLSSRARICWARVRFGPGGVATDGVVFVVEMVEFEAVVVVVSVARVCAC